MWRNNSLSIVLALMFLASLAAHSVAGWHHFNEEQREHGQPEISYSGFLKSSEFGETVFQNWQSEFLAVLAIVILSIWLRQWGSPESKPVHAAHDATGSS